LGVVLQQKEPHNQLGKLKEYGNILSTVYGSDVVLKTGPGLKTGLKTIFEVLVLVKAVLVLILTLDGLRDLKNCGLKTKKS